MRARDSAIHSILHEQVPQKLTKSERRRFQMINAAIDLFATRGIELTRYEDIAQKCGITRPLVQKYFPDREDLFLLAMRTIRAGFQKVAIDAMSDAKTSIDKVSAYILSTFAWINESPRQAKVWLLFYYYCGIQLKHRKTNSELVNMGHDRLTALILEGVKSKEFTAENPQFDAKIIQNLITGSLVSRLTEIQVLDEESLKKFTLNACLSLIQKKPPPA